MRVYWSAALLIGFLVLPAGFAAGAALPAEDPTGPARAYYEEGRRQEAAGQLVEATRMYKLAHTLTPQAADITAALERVQVERRRLAEVHFQRGRAAYAEGDLREGRLAALTALRLWPDHAAALEMLREYEKTSASRQVRHRVRKGETLTTIARKYYGDARKYTLLVRANRIADARRIRIGQVIVVPAAEMAAMPSAADEGTLSRTVAAQVANYRAAGRAMLQTGDYEAAIVEFRKVLNAVPDDLNIKADLCRTYDAHGRKLWDLQAFDRARQRFEACLALGKGCPVCRDRVQACEDSYKERLYNRGMSLLQNQDPEAALSEWQTVERLDPAYRDVAEKIRRTRTITEGGGRTKAAP